MDNNGINKVKEYESIEKALKRFKKKFDSVGVIKELRRRIYFEKPSVACRGQLLRAAYRQKIYTEENN